jgi:formylglycine-generating enzyme required for sulfatase activity
MKTLKQCNYSTRTFAAIAAVFTVVFMECDLIGNQTPTFEMVWVEGSDFEMGKDWGTAATGDVSPLHTVTLDSFYISKYPVTQAQYWAVIGNNPSHFDGTVNKEPASGEAQGIRPVDSVKWYDAIVFCNKLSRMEGLNPAYSINDSTDPSAWGSIPTGDNDVTWDAVKIVNGSNGYRLPTEAQWEYAAKGGNPSSAGWVGYTYSGSDTIGDVAWYNTNSDGKTHEVMKKAPNRLGLYDMSGNVYEWCWDWYGDYSEETQTNPTGALSGSARVLRGGSWFFSVSSARSVYRTYGYPSFADLKPGLRLVRPYQITMGGEQVK